MRLMHLRLLIPALLLVTMLIGSVSAPCPIPPPPYNPKSPQEDIVKVEAYIEQPERTTTSTAITIVDGHVLFVTVTFAAPTPPKGQGLIIIITKLEGTPPVETSIYCGFKDGDPQTSYTIKIPIEMDSEMPKIAVYAELGTPSTDRAPNNDLYMITSLSAAAPNIFYDPEATVGGITIPTNTLAILAPYLAIAGLSIISVAVLVNRRRA